MDPRTPAGDIPSLYSLAASNDKGAVLKLIGIYNGYIKEVATNLQNKYRVRVALEDLIQEGIYGLLISLKTFELISGNAPYATWIEKNIKTSIAQKIHEELKAKGIQRVPDEL